MKPLFPNSFCRSTLPIAWPLAAMLLAGTGHAQSSEEPSRKNTEEAPVQTNSETPTGKAPSERAARAERMVITGTRLRQIDIEKATPTKVLVIEDAKKAGATNITEILQGQTENTFGSFNGGGGYVSVGQATIDLRGLGANRTLILVNGRRLPSEASLGGTNINNIPLAMVEKIEVLKASASSVYGADAVAGVINVITKKSVSGSEVSTQANLSQQPGGNSYKASAVTGFNVSDTDISVAVGGGKRERILIRDRDQVWQERSPYDLAALGTAPGTYSWGLLNPEKPDRNNGIYGFNPSANCLQSSNTPLDPNNTYCVGSLRSATTGEFQPEIRDGFGTLNIEKEFGSLQSSSTFMVSQVETSSLPVNRTVVGNQRGGSYNLLFKDAPQELKDQAASLGLSIQDDQMLKITARKLLPEFFGNTESRDTSIGGMTSLKGPISDTWDWTVEASYFQTKREKVFHKAPDQLEFIRNLYPVSTSESPKINIFKDDLSQIGSYFADLESEESNAIASVTAFASGTALELPNGPLNIAAGASVIHEDYKLTADKKDQQFLNEFPETATVPKARFLGSFAAEGKGQRDVKSVFTELGLPLVKNLELSVSGRFDHYSDFGSTFNYGTSLVASPWQNVKFRGNLGSGFRAPSLAEIFNSVDGGYLSVKDEKYCDNSVPQDNPCGPNGRRYTSYVNSPGNDNLKEETSIFYNFGAVVEPFSFLNLTADYWSVDIKDIINQESLDELIEKEIRGESTGDAIITRDTNGRISRIDNSYANLGRLRSNGYDLSSKITLNSGDWRYGLGTSYSRVLSRKSKDTLTSPEKEEVGSYGLPRYRLSNTFSVGTGAHDFKFDASTVGKQESSLFESEPAYGYISPETIYSTSYAWNYSENGTLGVGVYNLEDRLLTIHNVDRDTGAVSYNRGSLDARGRQLQVSLRQSF